jgi:flagellar hook-associated protein 3 FlgL
MSVIDNSFYPLQSNTRQVTQMRQRFDALQQQLATGERATTLAELGGDRYFDLTIRSRMARVESYGASLTAVNLRVDMLGTTLTRLDGLASEARGTMSVGGYGQGNLNLATAPGAAAARLDEVMNLLNNEVAGRYLFGGSSTDGKPVASASAVLDGEGGRAGFRTVSAERKLADLGTSGLGRLTLAATGNSVAVSEDGSHPFGFKLSTLSSTSPSVSMFQPSGDPANLSVDFTAQPAAGTSVSIGLTLPDGSETQIRLVAGGEGAGGFAIGASTAETAQNFAQALGTALQGKAAGELSVASAFAAADSFFAGQGQTAMRVDGPPYETATALRPATATDTVTWYRGSNETDARGSVSAKIDDAVSVDYGVQANEQGLTQLVKTLAVMASETYPSGDATSRERFDAVATRQFARLAESNANKPGSIEAISVEIGLVKSKAGRVAEQQARYAEQLETLRSGIEGVSMENVAMEILALKTRLEASYQTASLVSQLSLVNYMR